MALPLHRITSPHMVHRSPIPHLSKSPNQAQAAPTRTCYQRGRICRPGREDSQCPVPLRDPPGPPASGRQAGSSPTPGTQQTSINTDHDPDTLLSKRDPQNVPSFKEFVVKKDQYIFCLFYFATLLNAKARSNEVSGQNPEISDRKKTSRSPHTRE